MTNNIKFPNFLIVGAAKAATTTIHEYLKQHPEIFMTEDKEPCFFALKGKDIEKFYHPHGFDPVVNKESYLRLFENAKQEKIRGESSTPYLFLYEDTIKNIKCDIVKHEDVKILIVLREPVERAYSQYIMYRRELWESNSFEEALELEEQRLKNNYHFDYAYYKRGLYAHQVEAYQNNFKNVKVVFYEDFKKDNIASLNEIITFLGLSKFEFQKIDNRNIGGIPKSKILLKILRKKSYFKKLFQKIIPNSKKKFIYNYVFNRNLTKAPKLNQETKIKISKLYEADIKKLEKLLDIDLTSWKLK